MLTVTGGATFGDVEKEEQTDADPGAARHPSSGFEEQRRLRAPAVVPADLLARHAWPKANGVVVVASSACWRRTSATHGFDDEEAARTQGHPADATSRRSGGRTRGVEGRGRRVAGWRTSGSLGAGASGTTRRTVSLGCTSTTCCCPCPSRPRSSTWIFEATTRTPSNGSAPTRLRSPKARRPLVTRRGATRGGRESFSRPCASLSRFRSIHASPGALSAPRDWSPLRSPAERLLGQCELHARAWRRPDVVGAPEIPSASASSRLRRS